MKCTIVNRNIPLGGSITAHSALELADYLEQQGVEVSLVALRGADEEPDCESPVTGGMHLLPRIYDGKNKVLRLLSSLLESRQLVKRAACLKAGPIICMTDPPMLNYWMARAAKRTGCPWVYWSMDLYPDAFVAAGLVPLDSFVYRRAASGAVASSPSHLLALGPEQAKYIQAKFPELRSSSVLPCGISRSDLPSDKPSWAEEEDRIIVGYAGNLGEAHSDAFVSAAIESIDPEKQVLVLALYGAKSEQVKAQALGKPGVILVDSVDRRHLRYIDLHLVTLLTHWDHICVPSKAVSAVCEGGAILFHGSESNDNWQLLNEAAWRVDPASDPRLELKDFFTKLDRDAIESKKAAAKQVGDGLFEMKATAFKEVYEKIVELQ